MNRSEERESKRPRAGKKTTKASAPRGKGDAKPAEASAAASGARPRGNISDVLRQEAERRWADADRATARRTKRRTARAAALKSHRATAQTQRKKITGLKAKLRRAEASLKRRRRADDSNEL